MKKNIKKVIPAFLVASILGTSTIFANNTEALKMEQSVTVTSNENLVFNLIKEGENVLFPVRTVFEKLGFEVSYDAINKIVTLAKGPQYVTFNTKQDAYTFARTAPQKLGQAPLVKEGVTYAPVTLLTEIMQMQGVIVQDLTLTISLPSDNINTEVTEENKQEVKLPLIEQNVITEIDEDGKKIKINDFKKGEVVLNIENIKPEFKTDEKMLLVGQAVEVEYSDMMTASQPPMNTPKSLKIVQKYNAVEVLEVSTNDKNETRILIRDENLGEVLLITSKDTNVKDLNSIKKGQILKVAMSNAMTLSIPPQTFAKEIEVIEIEELNNQDEQNVTASKVEVISYDENSKKVLVKDEKLGEVLLNISSNTELIFQDETQKDNLYKKGQKLEVVFSPMMTKSLPPINNPIKVVVLK